ncbi:hypothetical protein BN14_07831 [Rhizoctonia solani AG-1 IB]|uniref:Uncharacterized protein n=1 Tax=Thanatephorus cucumeris (strain AG1-IB / isolate 7/3/14) TaxID=1108050 RepID=M5C3W9_THACB|nr:hypothetical protein BN14_07831 [Rhizoctonia solani AG-1 IB]
MDNNYNLAVAEPMPPSLVEIGTYTVWQNGPYVLPQLGFLPDYQVSPLPPSSALMYPDTSKYRDPADFHFEPLEEAENQEPDAVAATGVVATYYTYDYMHPVYSSAAETDRGCGFPMDLDEEDPMEFTGTQFPSNEPIDSHYLSFPYQGN